MSGTRLRRRLDRLAGSGGIHPDYLEAAARRAGVSPTEVIAEARRIHALCQAAGAWTEEACLAVVAADSGVSVESLRAELADLRRTLPGAAA